MKNTNELKKEWLEAQIAANNAQNAYFAALIELDTEKEEAPKQGALKVKRQKTAKERHETKIISDRIRNARNALKKLGYDDGGVKGRQNLVMHYARTIFNIETPEELKELAPEEYTEGREDIILREMIKAVKEERSEQRKKQAEEKTAPEPEPEEPTNNIEEPEPEDTDDEPEDKAETFPGAEFFADTKDRFPDKSYADTVRDLVSIKTITGVPWHCIDPTKINEYDKVTLGKAIIIAMCEWDAVRCSIDPEKAYAAALMQLLTNKDAETIKEEDPDYAEFFSRVDVRSCLRLAKHRGA